VKPGNAGCWDAVPFSEASPKLEHPEPVYTLRLAPLHDADGFAAETPVDAAAVAVPAVTRIAEFPPVHACSAASVVIVAAVFVSFNVFDWRNFAGIPSSSSVPIVRFAVIVSDPVVPEGTTRSAHVSIAPLPPSCASVIAPAVAVVVPRTFVVVIDPEMTAPRIACAQPHGRESFCEMGHGADTDGHLAVEAFAASAAMADPESPLDPPDKLIATGAPVMERGEP
jgi:hypothetical protein